MTVVDASVVVAALLDDGPAGVWSADVLSDPALISAHLMPVEVTQTIRRLVHTRSVSAEVAALALDGLADLTLPLFDFAPYSDRVWELRDALTAYDAWYVALAESFDVPLATLDRRLAKAAGPRCDFRVPG